MMGYRKWLAILVAVVMVLALFPAVGIADGGNGGCGDCTPSNVVELIAGQNLVVGTVTVTNDDKEICVTYALNQKALDDGWLIYETHLYIGDCSFEGVLTPTNTRLGDPYNANPIPGAFPYGEDDLDGVEEWSTCILLEDLEVEFCDDVCIAAHAVIERTECETLAEAPYGGLRVDDSNQGLRYNYTAVRAQRSNPDAALTFTTGQNEANFFSLGFQEDRTDEEYAGNLDNAWIIIEFDLPILNGPGDDLRVIEDTWGLPYPDETADVWVSQDGITWVPLGEADNQNPWMNYHTITDFDLEDVGLDYARFVKVQDTSNRADFASRYPAQGETLDGFDLNAVVALQNHVVCEDFNETAWGDGDRFNEKGNWGLWFKYKICPPEVCVPASVIYGIAGTGGTGGLWEIEFTDTGIEETLLMNYSISGDTYSGNGLAFDEENNRLYFAVVKGGGVSDIYFYDFNGDITLAAAGVPGTVYGATWGAGKYWYIPNGSNDMRTVTFDTDGINGTGALFEGNFAGGKSFNFGDIALDPDELVIYVSTSFSGSNKEFFKYDLNAEAGSRYSPITTDAAGKAIGLQLAFGEDGVLYGHNTFGQNPSGGVSAKEFFEVEKAGTATTLGTGTNAYNDLASGPSFCDK